MAVFSGTMCVFFVRVMVFGIARQAVEVRTKVAGKGLQLVECTVGFKHFGIQFNGTKGRVATGAAAGVLLGLPGVWG